MALRMATIPVDVTLTFDETTDPEKLRLQLVDFLRDQVLDSTDDEIPEDDNWGISGITLIGEGN